MFIIVRESSIKQPWVVRRFEPAVKPDSAEMVGAIEGLLKPQASDTDLAEVVSKEVGSV